MHQLFEVKKNLDLTPFKIEQRIRDAGFVDVQVKYANFDVGDWRHGCKNKEATRAVRICKVKVLPSIVEGMKEYYPNDGERAAFAQRIIDDLENEKYHLYAPVICVTGRRPDEA